MHAPAPTPRKKAWQEKLTRSGYFFGAVLLHLVAFLLVSTLVIWRPAPPPPIPFEPVSPSLIKPPPPPPPTPSSAGSSASNPQMDPQSVVVPPPALLSTITSVNSSSFTAETNTKLNDAMSHLSTDLAKGSGLGPTGGGPGEGGGNGLFGIPEENGTATGLEGTFYDFTRTQEGGSTNLVVDEYIKIVAEFSRIWKPPENSPCYKSSVHLSSKFFFFPPIPDTQAGTAFQTPSSTEAFWIAHYHGSFTADSRGEYRLMGFGDNVLSVRINDKVVLDASDLGILGLNRTPEGPGALLPGKDIYTPVFMGESFVIEAGQTVHMDVAVGDEGGIFCAGLFLVPKDATIAFADNGIPKLPLFVVGTMAESDKKALLQYLPPECLSSPVTFTVVPETTSDP